MIHGHIPRTDYVLWQSTALLYTSLDNNNNNYSWKQSAEIPTESFSLEITPLQKITGKYPDCRNQTAPNYLTRDLQWADTDDSRRRLRSATTQKLLVRRTIGLRRCGTARLHRHRRLKTDLITCP